jgi:hypothetical protein
MSPPYSESKNKPRKKEDRTAVRTSTPRDEERFRDTILPSRRTLHVLNVKGGEVNVNLTTDFSKHRLK